jgi:Cellulase N-terminal ig-like domain
MSHLKFSPSVESRTLVSAYIRVNQVGYVETATKQAVVLASGPETGATFQVLGSGGQTVYSAPIGANLGKWNDTFGDTYLLDFSSVTAPGTYSLVVTGPDRRELAPVRDRDRQRPLFRPALQCPLLLSGPAGRRGRQPCGHGSPALAPQR